MEIDNIDVLDKKIKKQKGEVKVVTTDKEFNWLKKK